MAAPDGEGQKCDEAVERAKAAVAKVGQVTACPAFEEAVNTCGDGAPLHLLYNAALVCGKVPRCDLKVDYLSRAVALCRTRACGKGEAGKLDIDLSAAQQSCRCSISVSATRNGGSLAVGGRESGKLPTVVEVGAGDHEIKATWAGVAPLVRTVRCSKPGLQQISLTPPPPSPKAPGVPGLGAPGLGTTEAPRPPLSDEGSLAPWGWTAVAVGAVSIGVGAGFLAKAQGHLDDRDAAFADVVEASDAGDAQGYRTALDAFERAHDQKSTANAVGIAGLVVGGVVLATGVVLLSIDVSDDATTSRVVAGPGFVGVTSTF